MKNYYTFPAILAFDVPGDVGFIFPDLPGCTGQCKTDANVMAYAQETLAFHIASMIDDNEEIPMPTAIQDIMHEPDEAIMPVQIYLPQFKEIFDNKADNRTVTLPHWLNVIAKEAGVNFSFILQEALMKKLGIHREIKHRKTKART